MEAFLNLLDSDKGQTSVSQNPDTEGLLVLCFNHWRLREVTLPLQNPKHSHTRVSRQSIVNLRTYPQQACTICAPTAKEGLKKNKNLCFFLFSPLVSLRKQHNVYHLQMSHPAKSWHLNSHMGSFHVWCADVTYCSLWTLNVQMLLNKAG